MKYCLKIRITDFLVYICTMCARVRLCVWHWQERDHPTFFTIPWPSHSLLEWVEVKAVFGDDPELLTFLSLFTREVVGWCVCERKKKPRQTFSNSISLARNSWFGYNQDRAKGPNKLHSSSAIWKERKHPVWLHKYRIELFFCSFSSNFFCANCYCWLSLKVKHLGIQ